LSSRFMKSAVLFLVSTSMNLIFPFCISNFSFSCPLWVWIFQQVRLLCNPFQPFLFLLRQLPIVQFEPLADKGHRSLFRVAVWAGGFFGGLQEIFQRIVLRDTEKNRPCGLSAGQGLSCLYPAVSHGGKSCHRQCGRRSAALTAGRSDRDCAAS